MLKEKSFKVEKVEEELQGSHPKKNAVKNVDNNSLFFAI